MADPIGLLKDVSQVIKKYNDLELMKQVVDRMRQAKYTVDESVTLRKKAGAIRRSSFRDPAALLS